MKSGRVVFVFFTIILQCFIDTSCVVCTSEIILAQGKLKGTVDNTKGYKAYLGIPYASIVKRFQEAGPAPAWKGTKVAINGSIKCNQYSDSLKTTIGQEDCLVANVFTPINQDCNLLPVMVFIHGGGFETGSNNVQLFNPTYFVRKDVIMVTINYRIGAFGFLCLHDAEATGNIGLKDATAALIWVKNNIKDFGGDPNSITVFGESAGATVVHYIITTGKYKGLFDKAILQSGSVLMPNKIDLNPIRTASIVASKIGYKTEDPNELLKVFQNASANDIIEASRVDTKNQPLKMYRFRPCVESPAIENESFITSTPKKLIQAALDSNLSIILGVNNAEGIAQAGKYDSNGLEDLISTLSDIIPENIKFTDESEKEQLTKDIQRFYFEKGINYDSLIDFFSDSMVIYSSLASAYSFLSSNVTMYNYYFKYDSSRNFFKIKYGLPNKTGASHADDLIYMFDPVMFDTTPVQPPEGKDLRIINVITRLWTNFAKTRNPSSTTTKWIPSKNNDLKFLQLDNEIKMIPLPNRERFQFWERVYKRYTWH